MPAPPCKLVRDASDRLCIPHSTLILCTLSKTDCVFLIMWSPSGYTPVWPKWPDAPSSSCLLIKMWQLAKAHGVTRNEPKIHVICYITLVFQFSRIYSLHKKVFVECWSLEAMLINCCIIHIYEDFFKGKIFHNLDMSVHTILQIYLQGISGLFFFSQS